MLASNIGQADGGTVTFQRDHAMPFTPGFNPGGYRLESVDIEFASATSSAFDSNVLAVEIRRGDAHLRVGEFVGRLTNPQGTSFAADRRIRFTAPGGGIDLEPRDGPTDGRTYFLVLDVAGQRDADFAKIRITTSIADDAGGAALVGRARPTTTITESELRTYLNSISDNWGWNAVYTALICLEAPPGLEFDPAHLTWNESQGCGEFEYYGPDGNKIAGNTPQQRRQNALAANAPWQTGMHSTSGASMELPDSAPGPKYKVRLTTQPSETVKVNIHDPNDLIWWGNNGHRTLNRVLVGRDRRASNGRGGAGKPTLTFTPSNWNQWQTVKAKVACTDHFPDAVPLKHVIQGEQGDFDGAKHRVNYGKLDQSWTVWVRVNDETPPVTIEAEGAVSGLPPAGQTIFLEEGATKDFKIRIGERILPNGSSGSVSVHLFAEPVGNVIRATRRDGQPFADGVLHDTMVFTPSSREQWVRLTAVGAGETRLVVSAERDFTWAHETRRHWSPEWPVTVGGICGRTKAVRDAIVGMIPGVSDCANVTRKQLAAITGRLSLQRQNLSSLKVVDFKGLTSLRDLWLYENQLTSLPPGIFDDLAGLVTLDLDDNQITTLRAGIFDHNPMLNTLNMQRNQLQKLPENIFRRNRSLHAFWLAGNPGAPFRPAAPDAGPDQSVATGAEVTLSGAAGAGGPWGDNVRFRWWQVDGPASNKTIGNDVLPGGSKRAATTFTAPAAPTTLHFRLAAEPVVFHIGDHRGIGRGYDWVTITVGGGGQSSPQEDAQPAQAEPACVSDTLLAEAQLAASETYRSPDHVERWSRVLAAFGEENAYSNNPMTIAEAQAQADRGLKRWAPVAPALECLASQQWRTRSKKRKRKSR